MDQFTQILTNYYEQQKKSEKARQAQAQVAVEQALSSLINADLTDETQYLLIPESESDFNTTRGDCFIDWGVVYQDTLHFFLADCTSGDLVCADKQGNWFTITNYADLEQVLVDNFNEIEV